MENGLINLDLIFKVNLHVCFVEIIINQNGCHARLAQSVERWTLNPTVVGSSPTLGECFCHFNIELGYIFKGQETSNSSQGDLLNMLKPLFIIYLICNYTNYMHILSMLG